MLPELSSVYQTFLTFPSALGKLRTHTTAKTFSILETKFPKLLELLKSILYHFTYKFILFILKLTNLTLMTFVNRNIYYLTFFFYSLPAPASLGHSNDYLSKSHCLLTRYEGFLDANDGP